MSETNSINSSHLRPYDSTLEDNMTIYDKQPYKKDPDLCGADKVKLVSGNVVKFYTQNYKRTEPFIIDNKDCEIKERLINYEKQRQLGEAYLTKEAVDNEGAMPEEVLLDSDISEEAID